MESTLDQPRPVSGPESAALISVTADYLPRRMDVLELDMGDGFILYDGGSNLVHHLNQPASIIWRLCDGQASIEQLASEIAEEFSREFEPVFSEVATTIAELDLLKLVENAAREQAKVQ